MRHRDPVCGMMVGEVEAAARVDLDGRTYWFCSDDCRRRFEHGPEQFVRDLSYDPGPHAAG